MHLMCEDARHEWLQPERIRTNCDRPKSRLGWLGCVALCLIMIPGCGSGRTGPTPVRISGVVKFNGKPLDNGTVMFSPADPKTGRVAQGAIEKNGNFKLSTFDPGDGVLAGSYSVSVTSTEPGTEKLAKDKGTGIGGKSAIPERYGDPKKSQLQQTIAAGDSGKVITLDLKE